MSILSLPHHRTKQCGPDEARPPVGQPRAAAGSAMPDPVSKPLDYSDVEPEQLPAPVRRPLWLGSGSVMVGRLREADRTGLPLGAQYRSVVLGEVRLDTPGVAEACERIGLLYARRHPGVTMIGGIL